MSAADWPIDDESYSRIRDSFLGGPDFIRVMGPPIWAIDGGLGLQCACGAPTHYVCGIGWEADPSAFVGGVGFIAAETARHFFWCQQCREMQVITDVPG
jgi:hypothetical protein